jgi:hypothetical protein
VDRSRILRSRVVDFLRSTPLLWHIIQREISLRYLIEARTNVAMGRVFLGVMQSAGQAATQAVSFVPTQGSAMTYARGRHLLSLSPYASGK